MNSEIDRILSSARNGGAARPAAAVVHRTRLPRHPINLLHIHLGGSGMRVGNALYRIAAQEGYEILQCGIDNTVFTPEMMAFRRADGTSGVTGWEADELLLLGANERTSSPREAVRDIAIYRERFLNPKTGLLAGIPAHNLRPGSGSQGLQVVADADYALHASPLYHFLEPQIDRMQLPGNGQRRAMQRGMPIQKQLAEWLREGQRGDCPLPLFLVTASTGGSGGSDPLVVWVPHMVREIMKARGVHSYGLFSNPLLEGAYTGLTRYVRANHTATILGLEHQFQHGMEFECLIDGQVVTLGKHGLPPYDHNFVMDQRVEKATDETLGQFYDQVAQTLWATFYGGAYERYAALRDASAQAAGDAEDKGHFTRLGASLVGVDRGALRAGLARHVAQAALEQVTARLQPGEG